MLATFSPRCGRSDKTVNSLKCLRARKDFNLKTYLQHGISKEVIEGPYFAASLIYVFNFCPRSCVSEYFGKKEITRTLTDASYVSKTSRKDAVVPDGNQLRALLQSHSRPM